MTRAKRVLQHLGLLALGLVLAVVTLELALRTTAWVLTRAREPLRLTSTRKAGTVRILCLGESTTFDVTMRADDSYPTQLQRMLNERRDGRRYEIVNRGKAATTTDRIVAGLEGHLAKLRPDIVVTMMGINDGPADDPMFPVHETFRVVKLARLLAVAVPGILRHGGHTLDGGIAEIPRAAGGLASSPMAHDEAFALFIAGRLVVGGRSDEAEPLLLRLADRPMPDAAAVHAGVIAAGQLVVLNHQRGREDEAARYRRVYEDLTRRPNPRTARNYAELVRILDAHGIPLVAVQYPGLDVQPLRLMLADARNVVFVDNEETFTRAVRERPLKVIYRDLFAGMFGHATGAGNHLLAANVAAGVEQVVGPQAPSTAVRPLPHS
jgi:hypothetical protein